MPVNEALFAERLRQAITAWRASQNDPTLIQAAIDALMEAKILVAYTRRPSGETTPVVARKKNGHDYVALFSERSTLTEFIESSGIDKSILTVAEDEGGEHLRRAAKSQTAGAVVDPMVSLGFEIPLKQLTSYLQIEDSTSNDSLLQAVKTPDIDQAMREVGRAFRIGDVLLPIDKTSAEIVLKDENETCFLVFTSPRRARLWMSINNITSVNQLKLVSGSEFASSVLYSQDRESILIDKSSRDEFFVNHEARKIVTAGFSNR